MRGKYAGQAIIAPNGLAYSPSGVLYPTDPKSQGALLKPYGTITAHEMGHIGGGIVRRLVGKGRILEHLERQAREHRQLGEVSVFLLYVDGGGTLYYSRQSVDRKKVRSVEWQNAAEGQTLPLIRSDTRISRPSRTRTLPPTLVPSARLDELRTEAKKTRTTLLSNRFVPSRVVSKPRAS